MYKAASEQARAKGQAGKGQARGGEPETAGATKGKEGDGSVIDAEVVEEKK